jgi:hypothetical protein
MSVSFNDNFIYQTMEFRKYVESNIFYQNKNDFFPVRLSYVQFF